MTGVTTAAVGVSGDSTTPAAAAPGMGAEGGAGADGTGVPLRTNG